jgi:hypothetical protein
MLVPALSSREQISHGIRSCCSVNFNFSFFTQKARRHIIPILMAGYALGIYSALYLIMNIIVLIFSP